MASRRRQVAEKARRTCEEVEERREPGGGRSKRLSRARKAAAAASLSSPASTPVTSGREKEEGNGGLCSCYVQCAVGPTDSTGDCVVVTDLQTLDPRELHRNPPCLHASHPFLTQMISDVIAGDGATPGNGGSLRPV